MGRSAAALKDAAARRVALGCVGLEEDLINLQLNRASAIRRDTPYRFDDSPKLQFDVVCADLVSKFLAFATMLPEPVSPLLFA